MKIETITSFLESWAPLSLQEHYDNAGLIVGNGDWHCQGVMVSLDVTENVVHYAKSKGCNLIVAHHPMVFSGLKTFTGKSPEERVLVAALHNEVAVYALHTNLDNVLSGVNGRIARILGLHNTRVLAPRAGQVRKLYTFVPVAQADQVRDALFKAGAGHVGKYSETSFNGAGQGTFKAGKGARPFVGQLGIRQVEPEIKMEVLFPIHIQEELLRALVASHPYEEVAYDLVTLENKDFTVGSGILGELSEPYTEDRFLKLLREAFGTSVIRHNPLTGRMIHRVAACGGAGNFLISNALSAGAEAFVTADIKYHDFFSPGDRLLLADIGHYESEQFTIELIAEQLQQKFPNFAVLKPESPTNPVHYYF